MHDKGTHQTELKIPTQKKRNEKKTGNDHDTTSWRAQKVQTAKERKRKRKKSLSWFFLQKNTNRKQKIHNSFSSNF
jgi:hypothetical protein